MPKNIEIISRGFIVKDGEVLLCKLKVNENYFFPGGHVEYGENAEEALKRELQEEIGVEISDIKFWGICENTFVGPQGECQEINIVFSAELAQKEFMVLEDHMEFGWFAVDDIASKNVLPESLREEFLEWNKGKKVFYIK
jgi:ADP-ribose pyrophosphatase YjhB (NUDIX family)